MHWNIEFTSGLMQFPLNGQLLVVLPYLAIEKRYKIHNYSITTLDCIHMLYVLSQRCIIYHGPRNRRSAKMAIEKQSVKQILKKTNTNC